MAYCFNARSKSAACFAAFAAAVVLLPAQLRGEEADEPGIVAETPYSVRLIDVDGKPVAGADVGISPAWGVKYPKPSKNWGYMDLGHSDADGVAQLTYLSLLDSYCLVAQHAGRKLIAVANLEPTIRDEPTELTLVPACEIRGETPCQELAERHREVGDIMVYVHSAGKTVMAGHFDEPSFHLPLPPGDYEISAWANSTYTTRLAVKVEPGSERQSVGPLELRMTELALLEGKPAPEIAGVLASTDGESIKLASLRGKCVLLVFGGWDDSWRDWLPRTLEIYDNFHDRGLEIIGIQTDLTERPRGAAVRLNEWLGRARQQIAGGREIPFPVALVSGEKTSFGSGISDQAYGATAARYGVWGYPEMVLIDRQGNVVGRFSPEKLQQALGGK